jgi:hypothetical protein
MSSGGGLSGASAAGRGQATGSLTGSGASVASSSAFGSTC